MKGPDADQSRKVADKSTLKSVHACAFRLRSCHVSISPQSEDSKDVGGVHVSYPHVILKISVHVKLPQARFIRSEHHIYIIPLVLTHLDVLEVVLRVKICQKPFANSQYYCKP